MLNVNPSNFVSYKTQRCLTKNHSHVNIYFPFKGHLACVPRSLFKLYHLFSFNPAFYVKYICITTTQTQLLCTFSHSHTYATKNACIHCTFKVTMIHTTIHLKTFSPINGHSTWSKTHCSKAILSRCTATNCHLYVKTIIPKHLLRIPFLPLSKTPSSTIG